MAVNCPECGEETEDSALIESDKYGHVPLWECSDCGVFRKSCPDCGTSMIATNDMSSEKANWICPECAPDFALANVSEPAPIDDPLPR
jgi:transposase-like protein